LAQGFLATLAMKNLIVELQSIEPIQLNGLDRRVAMLS
jgi:hypothetical protein